MYAGIKTFMGIPDLVSECFQNEGMMPRHLTSSAHQTGCSLLGKKLADGQAQREEVSAATCSWQSVTEVSPGISAGDSPSLSMI